MPEVNFTVGGRAYRVACGAGEEAHLKKAAAVLDAEAQRLIASGQKLPENTALLMAGLMVADQVVGNDGAKGDEARIKKLEKDLEAAKKEAEAAATQLEEVTKQRPEPGQDEKIANLTEERDAARAELAALKEKPSGAKDDDGALLERMASELERLADEMEAGAKAS